MSIISIELTHVSCVTTNLTSSLKYFLVTNPSKDRMTKFYAKLIPTVITDEL
jgi:hypothetical protein